jgi:hypothetical protein
MVEAAIDSGVKRFVFSSVIHPVLSGLPNNAMKAHLFMANSQGKQTS